MLTRQSVAATGKIGTFYQLPKYKALEILAAIGDKFPNTMTYGHFDSTCSFYERKFTLKLSTKFFVLYIAGSTFPVGKIGNKLPLHLSP